MSRVYYVIELTPRWLAILLAALVGLMVLAFVGGYGAAWQTLGAASGEVQPSGAASEEMTEVEIPTPSPSGIVVSEATPVPPKATVAPVISTRPAPTPKPTATPEVTPVPRPTAPPKPASTKGFEVQVLASNSVRSIEKARRKLVDLGFPNSEHHVVETRVAGGAILLKLRIGPFPDHQSAERVKRRMQAGGFPDAWVVTP